MDNEAYDLIFKAELVKGFELAQVKKNLQALFRISEAKIEALFTGKPIALKKNLDADTANKYRVAMKKAGAIINVVQAKTAVETPAASQPKPAAVKPPQSAAAVSVSSDAAYQTELGAQADKPAEPKSTIDAPDFDVAAAGDDLLKSSERNEPAFVAVDVSHLTVTEQQGNLVDANELVHDEPLDIDIPNLDVAAAGSDLLNSDEREVVASVAVDISGLSVDPVGETLGPKKAPAPPAPNVDHIKLSD